MCHIFWPHQNHEVLQLVHSYYSILCLVETRGSTIDPIHVDWNRLCWLAILEDEIKSNFFGAVFLNRVLRPLHWLKSRWGVTLHLRGLQPANHINFHQPAWVGPERQPHWEGFISDYNSMHYPLDFEYDFDYMVPVRILCLCCRTY